MLFEARLGAFSIYPEISEIPVGSGKWNMIFRFVPLENFRKNGTCEKVVQFSRWKFSDETACSFYGFRKGFYQFQAISLVRKYGGYSRRTCQTPNVLLWSLLWTMRMLKLAYRGELGAFQTRVVEELFLLLVLLGTELPRVKQAKNFHKNLNFCEDRSSYRLQPPPG